MIKNITFPSEGKGYVYAKIEEPCPPSKHRYESFDHKTFKRIPAEENETYNQLLSEYKKEMKYYRKHKDDYVSPYCAKNLIGHSFDFEDNKVNVIFGPNGSGKTTMVKAIAGNAMCSDGFTRFSEQMMFGIGIDEYNVIPLIKEMMRNTSTVEWDGIPIYYDNFEQTRMNASNVLDGFENSIVGGGLGEELMYRIGANKISAGQHSMYILNKIIKMASTEISLEDVVSRENERFQRSNQVWRKCGNQQVEYFSQFPRFTEKVHPTMLFDEIDKSLDIETVWKLYSEVFPKIVEKWGNQIILVSHNPLILSDNIYNNERYHIVSIDPDYTKEMKNMLNGVKF